MVNFRRRRSEDNPSADSGLFKEALQQAEEARRSRERAQREAEERAVREAPARAAQKARDAERRKKEEAERTRLEKEKERKVAALGAAAREFAREAKAHRLPGDGDLGWKLYLSCSCRRTSRLEPTGQVLMGDEITELVYDYHGNHLEFWVTKKGELIQNTRNCKLETRIQYVEARVPSVEKLVEELRTIMVNRLAAVL